MIVCEKCKKTMRVEKVGIRIVENTEKGTPYKVWMSDRLKCPDCGHTVLFIGLNQQPLAHHHEESFSTQAYYSEMSFV